MGWRPGLPRSQSCRVCPSVRGVNRSSPSRRDGLRARGSGRRGFEFLVGRGTSDARSLLCPRRAPHLRMAGAKIHSLNKRRKTRPDGRQGRAVRSRARHKQLPPPEGSTQAQGPAARSLPWGWPFRLWEVPQLLQGPELPTLEPLNPRPTPESREEKEQNKHHKRAGLGFL